MKRKRSMRRKLNNESGFTLVELLCACLILILLSMVINAELGMVGKLYGSMLAENEAEILLSSASLVLSDELRYAVGNNVPDGGLTLTKDGGTFVFESDTYWNNNLKTEMYINSEGRLWVRGADETGTTKEYPVLPASDYGGESSISGTAYEIESINITKTGKFFKYTITVKRGTGQFATSSYTVDEKKPTATGYVKNMPHKP